jgi:DNA-binding response OmpR family regulator
MSRKILIVEDDADILGVVKELLENEGYQVKGLNYTESIIKSVNEHQPDMVILDFLLPGVNGGELCFEIKSHPETAYLPVIMFSGYPRVLESLGNFGADAFIPKPFDISYLLQTVNNCFDHNLAIA